MMRLTAFSDRDIGGVHRERLEDYAVDAFVVTPGGLQLQVGIVCDGVGSGSFGEQAAQIAAQATLDNLSRSAEKSIPRLLQSAIIAANEQVYSLLNGRGNTTIAVMAVDTQDNAPFGRLFIASVGDSQIWLIRGGKLIRLNTDHTLANERLLDGATQEEVARLERGQSLTRALGVKRGLDVDTGIYSQVELGIEDTEMVTRAQSARLGDSGIALKDSDTIFATSDGMREINPDDNEPYVKDEEFIRHTYDPDVQRTVRTLISYASARRPNDNLSISMIFVPSPSGKRGVIGTPPPMVSNEPNISSSMMSMTQEAEALNAPVVRRGLSQGQRVGLVLFVIAALFTVGAMGLLLDQSNRQRQAAEEEATALAFGVFVVTQTQVALNATVDAEATVRAAFTATPTITPTPTSTPTPTVTPTPQAVLEEQVGVRFLDRGARSLPVVLGGLLPALDQPSYIQLLGREFEAVENPADLFITRNSSLRVLEMVESMMRPAAFVSLLPDSRLFAEPGRFTGGLEIALRDYERVLLASEDGCLAVGYVQPETVSLACYASSEGCRYSYGPSRLEQGTILAGQRLLITLPTSEDEELVASTPVPLDYDETVIYYNTIIETVGSIEGLDCVSRVVDTDGDTVLDVFEPPQCVGLPGPVELSGCPDTDGDGVPDFEDACPTVPGDGPDGCPLDTDSDGVPDIEDECPLRPGPASNQGCPLPPTALPDRDRDGVPDSQDRCPDQPGPASNQGCPRQS